MTSEKKNVNTSDDLQCPSFSVYLSGIHRLRHYVKTHEFSPNTVLYGVNSEGAVVAEKKAKLSLVDGFFDCSWALRPESDAKGVKKGWLRLDAQLHYLETLCLYLARKNLSLTALSGAKKLNSRFVREMPSLLDFDNSKAFVALKDRTLTPAQNEVVHTRREIGLKMTELASLLKEPLTNIFRWEKETKSVPPRILDSCSKLNEWYHACGCDKEKLFAFVADTRKRKK